MIEREFGRRGVIRLKNDITYRDIVAAKFPNRVTGTDVLGCPSDYLEGADESLCGDIYGIRSKCSLCWAHTYHGEEIIYKDD